jgi:CHAT domain-containing protein
MRKNIYFFSFLISISALAQLPKLPKLLPDANSVKDQLADKAKESLNKEMEKRRAEFDSTSFNYAVSLRDNAGLFETEEKWQKNQKLLSDFASNKENLTPLEQASKNNEVGEMMYASSQFKQADDYFGMALTTLENNALTEEVLYSKVLANIGLLHHTRGRYGKSEEFTLKALELRKSKNKTSVAYGASVNNLAVLYKDMGRYNESEKLSLEAVQLCAVNPGKKSAGYAIVLNNQAMLFEEMGRFEQAEKVLAQSISVASEVMTEKSTNYQRLLINQALLYQELNKFDQADEIYKKAISIKEKKLGSNHPDYAHLLNLQAELYMQMNKTSEVESLLKRAGEIYKKKFGEEHPSYASVMHNLGNYYRIQSNDSEANTCLTKALNIRVATLGEKHLDVLATQESMALLNWQMNKIEEAATGFKNVLDQNIATIHEFFAPLSEAEKARFWDKISPQFQHYTAFVVDSYEKKNDLVGSLYNYQLTTKALLLNSGSKIRSQILNSGDKALIKEYKEWLDEKENLARIYSMSKTEIKDQKINIDSLERSANALEKKLSEKSNLFKSGYSINTITWKAIQTSLAAGDAAVEIIHLRKFKKILRDSVFYAAIVLTKEFASPQMVVLRNGLNLEKRYFSYYRNCIKGKMPDEFTYDQYWKAIDQKLGDKKNIYVSLDGIFNQINLTTIQVPGGGYMLDKRNFVLVTNTKDIVRLKSSVYKPIPSTAVLVGNPSFGNSGKVSALPGTKLEVESIQKLLTSNKYTVTAFYQANATEESVKKVSNPKILHIATHGFFVTEASADEKSMGIGSEHAQNNPMLRSGLLLANAEAVMEGTAENGILTAYEVMNLELDKTEIAVVSACETGLGAVKNGEGVYGLQRAFLVAGADALIMSLWKVNDEATQKLMTAFYKYFAQTNDKQKAFKAAQTELKSSYPEPYYWGAFVLVM